MAATLILVRHAAHAHLDRVLSGRMPGVPLSEAGRAQAAALAQRLAARGPALVQTSPVDRAEETACAVAEAASVAVEQVEALDEIDFGVWTGRSFAELTDDAQWDRWNRERGSARPPGGESMGEAQARIVAHLGRAAREWDGRTLVLVSHADVIRAAVCHVLGLELQAYWRFDVGPASATTLVWEEWGGRLVTLNERESD